MPSGYALKCPRPGYGSTMTSLAEPMRDGSGDVINLCPHLPQLMTWNEFRGLLSVQA